MKKFYAFAAAALAAVSMNAQVYIVGNFGGDGGTWTPEAPVALEKNADGNWEITLETSMFKVSTVGTYEEGKLDEEGNPMDAWAQFNAGALAPAPEDQEEGAVVLKADQVGKALALRPWGENILTPPTNPAMVAWKIVVSADYSTITLTTEAEVVAQVDAYLVGKMSGWSFLPEWKMTTEDYETYTYELGGDHTIVPGPGEDSEFKVAAQGWANINYTVGGEILADGEPNPCVFDKGANMWFSAPFEGTVKLVLTNGYAQEAELYFIKKEAGVESIELDANAPVEYFNLQGVRVANPENGLFIARQGNKAVKVVK